MSNLFAVDIRAGASIFIPQFDEDRILYPYDSLHMA